jgi:hypothetical protein
VTARLHKESESDAVITTWLEGSDKIVCNSSMTLKITPSSESVMWQVSGVSKDRDGRSIVKGVYNSVNGRCVPVISNYSGYMALVYIAIFRTPLALTPTEHLP